jgi:osmoprotectant transport system permease protein
MSPALAVLGEFGDAISFIFQSGESPAGGSQIGGKENLPLLWEHLKVTGAAMALALIVALPLGLWLGHTGRGAFATISVSNVGRAVPSVALIALFVAFFPGTSAFINVTLALALLAIPPILTNTYVGVRQVSGDAVDASAR